jgi:hypothetical protein
MAFHWDHDFSIDYFQSAADTGINSSCLDLDSWFERAPDDEVDDGYAPSLHRPRDSWVLDTGTTSRCLNSCFKTGPSDNEDENEYALSLHSPRDSRELDPHSMGQPSNVSNPSSISIDSRKSGRPAYPARSYREALTHYSQLRQIGTHSGNLNHLNNPPRQLLYCEYPDCRNKNGDQATFRRAQQIYVDIVHLHTVLFMTVHGRDVTAGPTADSQRWIT